MWTNPAGLLYTETESSPKTAKARAHWLNFQMAKWLPVWHGLKLTTELSAHSISEAALTAIHTFKEAVEEKLNLAHASWKEQRVDGAAKNAAEEWANLKEAN
jgi:hypothetical protein